MKRHIKRVATLSLGLFFILLGIVGLFVPFLQGILFLFVGLLILSKESKTAQTILEKLEAKYPRLYARVLKYSKKTKNTMTAWIKKMTWTKNRPKNP